LDYSRSAVHHYAHDIELPAHTYRSCFSLSGVGTGGTVTGVAQFWKDRKPIHVVAVEPEQSAVLSQTRAGEPVKPGPHKIQGIGAGFVPEVLDLSLIDEVVKVHQDDALAMVCIHFCWWL